MGSRTVQRAIKQAAIEQLPKIEDRSFIGQTKVILVSD
jgi:hypothetical protein